MAKKMEKNEQSAPTIEQPVIAPTDAPTAKKKTRAPKATSRTAQNVEVLKPAGANVEARPKTNTLVVALAATAIVLSGTSCVFSFLSYQKSF